jgi:hypothetical protein
MEDLEVEHISEQWRLFTDSSKVSWKAVLLHSGNKCPAIPLAHVVHKTETHENLQVLVQKVRYEEHRWNVCADLKL